jgi:hypothetical protein
MSFGVPKTKITTTVTVHGADEPAPADVLDTSAPPAFGDKFARTYVWNGERWVEATSAKPINWLQQDECPIYGTEEDAYAAGFSDGQLRERLSILEEMKDRVSKYEDAEFNDAVDVVWDRMTEEDKKDHAGIIEPFLEHEIP